MLLVDFRYRVLVKNDFNIFSFLTLLPD